MSHFFECILVSGNDSLCRRVEAMLSLQTQSYQLYSLKDCLAQQEELEGKVDIIIFVDCFQSLKELEQLRSNYMIGISNAITEVKQVSNNTLVIDASLNDELIAQNIRCLLAVAEQQASLRLREQEIEAEYLQQAKQSQLRGEVLSAVWPALTEATDILERTFKESVGNLENSLQSLHKLANQLKWLDDEAQNLRVPHGSQHYGNSKQN